MTIKNLIWDIFDIFTYEEKCQEIVGDDIEFLDCEILLDYGPLKKGYKCNITIDNRDYTMYIDGPNSRTFVPYWTCLDETHLAKIVRDLFCLQTHNKNFIEKIFIAKELFGEDIGKIIQRMFVYSSQPTIDNKKQLPFPF